MSKIRFGVIGCGYISKKSFIPALIECSCAELVGVSSKSLEKAHSYADEGKISIDVFTCNGKLNCELATDIIINELSVTDYTLEVVERFK